MRRRILKINASESGPYFRALASDNRLAILELLNDNILNVQQIADELAIAQPTVTAHVRHLEEAGLIATNFRRGQRGTQKTCTALYDEILIVLSAEQERSSVAVAEFSMPLGAYTAHEVYPTCGLAHDTSIIGLLDNAETFHYPERMKAKILWFAKGFIEYTFPRTLPNKTVATRLDLSAEICSEVAGWDNQWASDITLWVNGVEIGTWTSPGDFGNERGRLNPSWWQDRYSQFGSLKNWSITQRGSYIDGVKLSNVAIQDLNLDQGPIRVRLGNKRDARNVGGVTLFGSSFGNYQQDLVLRLAYDDLLQLEPEISPDEGGEHKD